MIRAYAACQEGSYDVLGFYYLLNTSVEHDQLGVHGGAAEFVDLDRIPAVYLGMIGVHQPLAKNGIGSRLMVDALKRTISLAEISGVWAMTLDALNEDVVPFYERFDFRRFRPDSREMYLTLGTMRQVFEAADQAG